MQSKLAHALACGALRAALLTTCLLAFSGSASGSTRPDLVALFHDARALSAPALVDGVPDYSAAAVDRQRRTLAAIRARLEALEPDRWPLEDQIDYLLVRAELDKLDYGINVYRAPSRSPNFYLSAISSFGMSSGATLSRLGSLVMQPPPFDDDRARGILDHMRRIPVILAQAQINLTEPTVEMSRWALPALADAKRNSADFAAALAPHFPPDLAAELPAAAAAMGEALASYRDWIEARLPAMAHAEPIGRDLYDWLLQRVWLLPYTVDDILALGEREYARYLTFTELELHRNTGLPAAEPAPTTAAYAQRTAADEKTIRAFLEERDALTVPDFIGPYRRTEMPAYIQAFPLWAGLSGYRSADNGAVKYSVPEDHPYTRTYWESIMRIDPSTNIFHDGIPGHHFQGLVSARHPSPIRSSRRERFKSEGWCTYWEEAALHLGFYDDRPRSRELIYNFLRLRALRVIIDAKMALGQMSVDEAIDALMSVPMDRRIAREEAEDFYAAPTGGLVYLIGKVQIEDLLRDRRRQLGDDFDLRAFHDRLVQAAWVPLALTEAEMMRDPTLVGRMLENDRPMPRPAGGAP